MVGVAVCQVRVPNHHLETRVDAVTPLVEFAAQAVGVHIVAHLHDQLVIDERHHVNIIGVITCHQRILHRIDAAVDVIELVFVQILIVGGFILETDAMTEIGRSCGVYRMMLGNVDHIIAAVHFHQVVTRDCFTFLSRFGQVQAMLPLGDHLGKNIHTIIDAVKEDLTVTALRHILHPRPRQFIGQHVADHALVGIGSEQCPIVILAHAQQGDFLLLAVVFQLVLERAYRVGFLGTVIVGGITTMTYGDITVIVNVLPGVGQRVGIIHPALAIPDDFHVSTDAFVAHDGISVHINPHDGQVG